MSSTVVPKRMSHSTNDSCSPKRISTRYSLNSHHKSINKDVKQPQTTNLIWKTYRKMQSNKAASHIVNNNNNIYNNNIFTSLIYLLLIKTIKSLMNKNNYTCLYLFVCLLTITVADGLSLACPPVNLIHRLATPNGASSQQHPSATHDPESPLFNHHQKHYHHNHSTPECDCTTIQEGGWEINCYSNQPSPGNNNNNEHKDHLALTSGDDFESPSVSSSSTSSTENNLESFDYMDYNILMVSFTVRYVVGRQVMITCDHGAPAFKPALFQGFGIEAIDTFVISNCEFPAKLPLSLILQRTSSTTDQQPAASNISPINNVATSTFTFKMGNSEFSVNNTAPVAVFSSSRPKALSQTSSLASSSSALSAQEFQETISPIRSLHLTSKKAVSVQQLNTLLSGLESLEQLTLRDFNLNDVHEFIITPPSSLSSSSSSMVAPPISPLKSSLDSSPSDISQTFNLPSVEVIERTKRDLQPKFVEMTTTESPDSVSSSVSPTTMPPPLLKTSTPKPSNSSMKANSTFMEAVPNKSREERVLAIPEVDLTFRPKDENGMDELPDAAVQPTTISPDFVFAENTESPLFPAESKDEEKESKEDKEKEEAEIMHGPKLDENALNLARLMPSLKILRLKSFINDQQLPPIFFQILKNLTNLEYLELDSNTIHEIPNHALSFAKNLRKIYLYKNLIQTIEEDAFKNLTSLEILDLSQNRLTDLPENLLKSLRNLVHIGLRNNQLVSLKPDVFRNNTELRSLDLSQNFNLEPLPVELFDTLASLSNVSLAYCNMSTISSDFGRLMKSIPKLFKLDLRWNKLTNLTIPGLFASNPLLSKLDLANNQIRIIAPSIFSLKNSTKLEELNLNKNRLNSLPDSMFNSIKNLKYLYISQNELEEINPMLFINLRSLEELNLSRNRIKTLNSNVNQLPFGIGSSLRTIDLSFNQLKNYEEDISIVNWSLYLTIAELNLRGNQFTGTLTIPSFSSTLEPVVLFDVSQNRFAHVSTQNLAKFQEEDWKELQPDSSQISNSYETQVRIEANPFHCDCFLFAFINFTKSPHRAGVKTLGRKTVFDMTNLSAPACHEPRELNEVPLVSLELDQLKCQVDDNRICPEPCKCHFRAQDSAVLIDCDHQNLETIPKGFFDISQFYNISVLEIGGAIISDVKSVELSLKNNSISDLAPLSKMLSWNASVRAYMPEQVSFYLDYNHISSLPTDLLANNESHAIVKPRIRRFSLIGNDIEQIPIEFLEFFAGLDEPGSGNHSGKHFYSGKSATLIASQMFLSNNPINCYNEPAPPESKCWVREFKYFLASHPKIFRDSDLIHCFNISTYGLPENVTKLDTILINISDNILCPILIPDANSTALVALSVACVVLGSSLFVVSVLYYRNKQTILAFIYIHFNPVFVCLSFSEDDLDEDKIYDAFVSYSSGDRDIVMQLIEKLEVPKDMSEMNALMSNGKTVHEAAVDRVVPEYEYRSTLKSGKDLELGNELQNDPTNYKLCIHERDWLPGNLISWNIVNSVQNSRRTILILSEQFIQSIWFQVEFHTAYYQMLEDKMDRLIVIVRGELPPKERLDKDLLYLLTTKTYLVWGEKWFWEKLYYALPHKRKSKGAVEFGKNARALEQNNFALTNGAAQKYGALNGKWKNGNGNRNEIMKDYVDQTIATHFQLNELSSGFIANGNGRNHSQRGVGPIATTTPQFVQPEAEPAEPIRKAPKSLRNSGSLANASPATLQAFSASGAYDNKTFIDETGT